MKCFHLEKAFDFVAKVDWSKQQNNKKNLPTLFSIIKSYHKDMNGSIWR